MFVILLILQYDMSIFCFDDSSLIGSDGEKNPANPFLEEGGSWRTRSLYCGELLEGFEKAFGGKEVYELAWDRFALLFISFKPQPLGYDLSDVLI